MCSGHYQRRTSQTTQKRRGTRWDWSPRDGWISDLRVGYCLTRSRSMQRSARLEWWPYSTTTPASSTLATSTLLCHRAWQGRLSQRSAPLIQSYLYSPSTSGATRSDCGSFVQAAKKQVSNMTLRLVFMTSQPHERSSVETDLFKVAKYQLSSPMGRPYIHR